jgi:ABC-type multidrug transport system fused ATPase/permease subunit
MAQATLFSLRRHVGGFLVLLRWMLIKASGWFLWSMLLSTGLCVVSVAAEMFAFVLLVRAVHAFDLAGGGNGAANLLPFPTGGSTAILIAIPTLALIGAGILTYLGKSIAIDIQVKFARKLSKEMVEKLGDGMTFYDRLSPPFGLQETEIIKAVTGDTIACGLNLRHSILHVISLIYLILGLGIVAYLAPLLLGLWLLAVGLIVPVIYAINVRTLREARTLAELAPLYRQTFSNSIRNLFGFRNIPSAGRPELLDRYVAILGGRLRVVELSRFAMSVVFALTVGGFLWIAQHPETRSAINIGYILLLFLAFRYTYQGFQGLSVYVTTVNRNLPAMMRVHDVYSRIGKLGTRTSKTNQTSGQPPVRLDWKIHSEEGSASTGTFEIGHSFALVTPRFPRIAEIAQIYGILANSASRNAFEYLAGPSPGLIGVASPDEGLSSEGHLEKTLSCEIVEAEKGRRASPDKRLLAFRQHLEQIPATPASIIFIDGNDFSRFDREEQALILQHLSQHLVFSISSKLGSLLADHPYNGLLISSGKRIAAVLPGIGRIDDVAKDRARRIFDSEPSPYRNAGAGAGEAWERDDDDLI